MPWMPGARCSTHGCTAMAVADGRGHCASHRPVGWYDRPSVHTQVVDEARMGRVKRVVLRLSPVCELCGVERATEVDHIIPVAGGDRSGKDYPPGWGMGSLYDRSNLQALCHECHARKTAAEAEELRAWRSRNRRRSTRSRVRRSV